MSTFDRIKKLIVGHLGADPAKVKEDACFITDLGTDSLDLVELVMAAEVEFDVEISADEAEAILTVRDAVRCIDGKRKVAA
jgi:acyl carrier protein